MTLWDTQAVLLVWASLARAGWAKSAPRTGPGPQLGHLQLLSLWSQSLREAIGGLVH